MENMTNTTKSQTIHSWRIQGLKLREGETYDMIYEKVQNTTHCELCNIELCDGLKVNARCMDHNHETGYFRKVLCRGCNCRYDKKINKRNKSGHRWISLQKTRNKNGNISITFCYQRPSFKRKASQSLTKLIALSFINLLKKPL